MTERNVVAVVPALNEEESIARVVTGLLSNGATEVIVVDNGSTDSTAAVARSAGARVVREDLKGYGRACLAGLSALNNGAEIVVFADGDACDDPTDLPTLISPILNENADLCIGSRMHGLSEKHALPPHSRFGNWLGASLLRILFGQRVTDMGPFRAIRRAALDSLHLSDPNFGWNIEMQAKAALAGLKVAEVPVHYRKRMTGRSKITGNLSKSLQAGCVIIYTILKFRVQGLR